jgi:GT2 family glycosyltransferase
VLRNSRRPFEVLFVDVGSLDGSADYLAGVAAAAPICVEVLRGEKGSDFPQVVGQALARAKGVFVAWVNNDVLVPEMWLQQLVALATANEVFGLVGPMANIAPEQQRISPIPYRLRRPDGKGSGEVSGENTMGTSIVDQFAQEFRGAKHGQWAELGQIDGYCWLAKREVLERVPLFAKRSEEGVLDPTEFSDRVRKAGYRIGCCRDLYVHHFGSNLMSG